MEDLFSTFSANQWTAEYCDFLVCVACVRATTWMMNRFQILFYDM